MTALSNIRFTKTFFLQLVLICVILVSLVGVFSSPLVAEAQTTTFQNPLNSSSPDPWMTYYNGNYYLAATTWSNSASVGLTMRRAPTIAALKNASAVRIWQDNTASRCCNYWAPEFHLLNGPNGTRWYMYFTGGAAGACCDTQRLHVLESAGTDPMGPYTYRSQLLPGWAIDGSILKIGGTNYLLYSQWQGSDQGVYIIQLSNPWTTTGSGVRISFPTNSWETVGGRTNEAPVALYHGSDIFVIFSASSCNTDDYKLGQLKYTGSNPLSASSWTKKSTPIFQKTGSVYAPGHNGFFKSPDGTEDWIVYHANATSGNNCNMQRTARIQKFTWNADGSPNLGSPLSTNTNITVPSGESGVVIPTPTRTRTPTPGGPTLTRTPTPVPGSFPVAGTYYRLINRNSSKVADVANCGTGDSADVRQWASLGNACQQWSFVAVGSYYKIVNRNSGKVLDVSGASTADGGNVLQYTDNGGNNQQWTVTSLGGGYYRIINRNSNKDLDVANCSTADGGNIQQWTWLNNNCQQWQIVP
jgi:GH43 family beta-xylosidase